MLSVDSDVIDCFDGEGARRTISTHRALGFTPLHFPGGPCVFTTTHAAGRRHPSQRHAVPHRRRDRNGGCRAGETVPSAGPEVTSPQVFQGEGPVAERFGVEMRRLYERGEQGIRYSATYFLSVLAELGPLGAARKLLRAPAVSDGFAALSERVVNPLFASLFSEQDLSVARARLKQFGYVSEDIVNPAKPDEEEGDLPEWTESDGELAERVWASLSETARKLFTVLLDAPDKPFSGEELALLVGADTGAGGVAGKFGWPGRYCRSVGRRQAWKYVYPDGKVRYSMSPHVAALFRRARDVS